MIAWMLHCIRAVLARRQAARSHTTTPTSRPGLDARIWLCGHCRTVHSDGQAKQCIHHRHAIGDFIYWEAVAPKNIEDRHRKPDTLLLYVDNPGSKDQLNVLSAELPLNMLRASVN